MNMDSLNLVDKVVAALRKLGLSEKGVTLNDLGHTARGHSDEYSVKMPSGVGIYVEVANPVGEGKDVWKPFFMLFNPIALDKESNDDYEFLEEGTWDCDEAVRDLVKLHVGTLLN